MTLDKLHLRKLTYAERKYIVKALRMLSEQHAPDSTERWAADLMLEQEFLDRLVYVGELDVD